MINIYIYIYHIKKMTKFFKIHDYKNTIYHGYPCYITGLNVFDTNYTGVEKLIHPGYCFKEANKLFESPYWRGEYVRSVEIPSDSELIFKHNKWWSNKIILGVTKYLGNIETIDTLVKSGVNIESGGYKLLKWSMNNLNYDIAKYMIKYGTNIHVLNNYVLMTAVKNGDINMVKYAILNSDSYPVNTMIEALEICINLGYLDIVEYIMNLSPIIHYRLLEKCAINGNLDMMILLNKYGYNLNMNDDYVLITASSRGYLNIIKYLLENSFINEINMNQALYISILNYQKYIAEYLISKSNRKNINMVYNRIKEHKDKRFENFMSQLLK